MCRKDLGAFKGSDKVFSRFPTGALPLNTAVLDDDRVFFAAVFSIDLKRLKDRTPEIGTTVLRGSAKACDRDLGTRLPNTGSFSINGRSDQRAPWRLVIEADAEHSSDYSGASGRRPPAGEEYTYP
jgi:hypothetical protein